MTFPQKNMEGYDYDAAASTIKIDDITSDKYNREILRKLKENDPGYVSLVVSKEGVARGCNEYEVEGARDLGWLGYFIGKNTKLQKLILRDTAFGPILARYIETFCRGVNSNRSIQEIVFVSINLFGGEIFRSLRYLSGLLCIWVWVYSTALISAKRLQQIS